MSFFYIHSELTGKHPDKNKIGKCKVPHGAVRLRQRFLADTFGLDHLWIGHPKDIDHLETTFKRYYSQWGTVGTGDLCNTELIHATQDQLVQQVNDFIETNSLRVARVMEGQRYEACRSSDCPLGIPSESIADQWMNKELKRRKWC